MVLFIPMPQRFDWPALMAEAKSVVEQKAKLRLLTTKDLEAALDVLRAAAMREPERMQAEGDPLARQAAEAVAYAVQSLVFVLNALHHACKGITEIDKTTDKEALLGGAGGDVRGHGEYFANKARQMSLLFLRAKGAVDIWQTFLLDTRLAPTEPLAPLLEALSEAARGLPTDFFRHPEATLGVTKIDGLHDQVRRLAVMAVEALLKADEIEHGAPAKGAKKRACEEVAKAFPATYRLPSSKAPGVTARHVAQWHEDFGPLLRGKEARGTRANVFKSWHREQWNEAALMLRGEHPKARFETPPDASFWRNVAAGWCDKIREELRIFRSEAG